MISICFTDVVGSKLLYHYQSSPSRMITSILSDYSWDSSKFQTLVPKGHYENKDNQKVLS